VFANAFLMYANKRIMKEVENDTLLKEQAQNTAKQVNIYLEGVLQNSIANYMQGLQTAFILPEPQQARVLSVEASTQTPKEHKNIGFLAGLLNQQRKASPNPEPAPGNLQSINLQSNTMKVENPNQGGKICPVCGALVNRKHWAAVYCSEPCKIAAWEAKTGKKLRKGVKK